MSKCPRCGTDNTSRTCGLSPTEQKAGISCLGVYHPDPNHENKISKPSDPPHPNPSLFIMRNPPPPGYRGSWGES